MNDSQPSRQRHRIISIVTQVMITRIIWIVVFWSELTLNLIHKTYGKSWVHLLLNWTQIWVDSDSTVIKLFYLLRKSIVNYQCFRHKSLSQFSALLYCILRLGLYYSIRPTLPPFFSQLISFLFSILANLRVLRINQRINSWTKNWIIESRLNWLLLWLLFAHKKNWW